MNLIRWILEWNKKLFPVFIIIFLVLVLLNSLKFDYIIEHPKLFNLGYKLIFILVSGILVLTDYLKKDSIKQKEVQKGGELN